MRYNIEKAAGVPLQIYWHRKVKMEESDPISQRITLRNEQRLTFTLLGKHETGTLSRRKVAQSGMRADKVVKEDERENEVSGDIIVETLLADMLDPIKGLNGYPVGRITVADNGAGISQRLYGVEYCKSQRSVPVTVQMETPGKAGLAFQEKPYVIFLP